MRTIFVTGGAGFIGSAFVRHILGKYPDVEIVNYDVLTYAGSLENISDIGTDRHRFVHGDICDGEAVLKALPSGCDAIFNFAAETHVDRSIVSADLFLQTNVAGTQVLLDASRERGVGRFVQISTDEVMGSLPEDRRIKFTERSPLRPSSPYAASKAAAELVVRAARETHGVDTVIVRSGNNFGPRQFPEKLIPLTITKAMRDQPVPLYGDGRHVRDWLHVDDHCRAIRLAYEKGRSGEIYNIGARNERENLEVVHTLLREMNKPLTLIEHVGERPGHDRRYALDPTKAETELGWRPSVKWEDGIRSTIAWYVANQDRGESVHGFS
jgi:dTDP-glucose 4,6-dehydratase